MPSPIASVSTSAAPSPTSCCSARGRQRPHQEDLVERRQLRPGDRRRAGRGVSRDRPRPARHRGDPPRHHGRLQRDPRAQGRARRPDHHQGLPRRAGDPHAAHAAALRPRLDQAAAAGRALPALVVDERIDHRGRSSGRSTRPTPSARSRRCSPRRSRRSRSACSTPSPIRRTSRCSRRSSSARAAPAAVALVRGAAGDQGVRAHLDHGDQRLRHADRRRYLARCGTGLDAVGIRPACC